MKPEKSVLLFTLAPLLLLTPLVYWLGGDDVFVFPKTALALFLAPPAAAAAIMAALNGERRPPVPWFPLLALAAYAAAGIAFSSVRALSFQAALPLIAMMCVFAAAAGARWEETEEQYFFWAIAAAAGVSGLYCVMQFFGDDPFFFEVARIAENVNERKVVGGFTGHSNYVGAFLAVAAPFLIGVALAERRSPAGIAAGAAAVASLTGVLLTMTRAAWLAAAGGLALFAVALALRKGRRFFTRFAVGGVLIGCAAFFVFSAFGVSENENPLIRLMTAADATVGSGAARMTSWGAALAIWKHHPAVGSGLGTYSFFYHKAQPELIAMHKGALSPVMNAGYAHNDYLQTLAETGAVGALLFGATMLYVFARGGLCLLLAAPRRASLAAGCLAALTAALINAFFMFPFRLPVTGVYIAFLAGFAVWLGAAETEKESSPRERPPAPRAVRVAALALCAAATALAWSVTVRALRADALMLRDPESSYTDQLRDARRLNPVNGEIPFRLGAELLHEGRPNEAFREFKRAEELFDTPPLHYYLWDLYRRAGDEKRAAAHLDYALKNGLPPPAQR